MNLETAVDKENQAYWVVAGNFRLYCSSQKSASAWVDYLLGHGQLPAVEVVREAA